MKRLEQEIERDFLHAISDPRFECGMRLKDRKYDLDVKAYIAGIYKRHFPPGEIRRIETKGRIIKELDNNFDDYMGEDDYLLTLLTELERKGLIDEGLVEGYAEQADFFQKFMRLCITEIKDLRKRIKE